MLRFRTGVLLLEPRSASLALVGAEARPSLWRIEAAALGSMVIASGSPRDAVGKQPASGFASKPVGR